MHDNKTDEKHDLSDMIQRTRLDWTYHGLEEEYSVKTPIILS
jgi:hypothetical protein